eukprot:180053_1
MKVLTVLHVLNIYMLQSANISIVSNDVLKNGLLPYLDFKDTSLLRESWSTVYRIAKSEELRDKSWAFIKERTMEISQALKNQSQHYYFLKHEHHFVHDYLHLFIMDKSTKFEMLFQLRNDYQQIENTSVFDQFQTNKMNHFRNSEASQWCRSHYALGSYKSVVNSESYQLQILNKWFGIRERIKGDQRLQSIWNGVLYAVKKNILRIILGQPPMDIQLFYDDVWLLFVTVAAEKYTPTDHFFVLVLKFSNLVERYCDNLKVFFASKRKVQQPFVDLNDTQLITRSIKYLCNFEDTKPLVRALIIPMHPIRLYQWKNLVTAIFAIKKYIIQHDYTLNNITVGNGERTKIDIVIDCYEIIKRGCMHAINIKLGYLAV